MKAESQKYSQMLLQWIRKSNLFLCVGGSIDVCMHVCLIFISFVVEQTVCYNTVYTYMEGCHHICFTMYFLSHSGNCFGGRDKVNVCLLGCVCEPQRRQVRKSPSFKHGVPPSVLVSDVQRAQRKELHSCL